jgi:TolB-like protein/Tfp pilus assembly protein PilF
MTSLLVRLKERKLVQWALAYLAGAWLLLQVVDVLGQNFDWPRTLFRSVTVVLAVGFLAALVLAWYHGAQGRQRVGGVELLMLSTLLVVAGAAVALVDRAEDAPGVSAVAGFVADAPLPRAERNSVAVLPFANLSRDPDNEYFSDGITDEILTTLANVGDLRVISRTSVMRYKSTEKSLRQIAAELGVAHVLEGSVQRAEGRVRITAQLIEAATDTHLWAERYDRPLEDVFAVQSEIARQIARALQARLSPAERARLERPRTTDLATYDYVLRGREILRRHNPRDAEVGLALLRRARELDPTYADAHVAVAQAFLTQYVFSGDRAWLDSMSVAARRAIDLDPQHAGGHSALGWALDFQGDREAALEVHQRAVALNPNDAAGLANVLHYGFGRLDEAVRWWRPALEGDPASGVSNWSVGRTYLHLGMTDRARPLLENAIEFLPGWAWPHFHLSVAYLLEGRRDAARTQIQGMLAASGSNPDALLLAGRHALATGDLPAARHYFEQGLRGKAGMNDWAKTDGMLGLAWVLQQSGEAERARELSREAAQQFQQRSGGSPRRLDEYARFARIRVLEGDRAGALQAFEEAVRRGWRFYNEGTNDPILESLRGEMAEVRADVDRMRARVEREGW